MISKVKILIFIFLTLSVACSHTQKIGDLVIRDSLEGELNVLEEINLSDKKKFDHFLKTLKQEILSGERQNGIPYPTWNKIGQLLEIYRSLTQLASQNKILVPQKTKLVLKTDSFCMDPGRSEPDSKEVFQWGTDDPAIPFYPKILKYYVHKDKKEKELIQELIWNLANKTYYEDYPEKLKKILEEIDPNAFLKLPSRTKSEMIDAGVSVFEEMSEVDIKETVQLVKGKYYSFEEFKAVLESSKSSYALTEKQFYSKIPKTNLFSTSHSQGYKQQVLNFYNPTEETQMIDLGNYYLKSLRSDVQRIAMTASFGDMDYFKKQLEQLFKFILGQLGSLYPNLEEEEQLLIKKYPYEALRVFWRMITVEHTTGKIFNDVGHIDGEADAFRHFVWAGFLAHDLGKSLASRFLDAHESGEPSNSRERQMDEHNNKKGIEAALQLEKENLFSAKHLYNLSLEALKNKQLIVLRPGGNIPDDASY